MVIGQLNTEPFHLKINNRWVYIDENTLRCHPGGSAITTYRNREATTVFHAFHSGSKIAYQQLSHLQSTTNTENVIPSNLNGKKEQLVGFDDINMGDYSLDAEAVTRITADFDRLKQEVRQLGLDRARHIFYLSKWLQALCLIASAIFLQSQEYFLSSAVVLGLAWQQLGWLIHDYCHHQHFKTRYYNDLCSYISGNLLQGFSSGGWKEQHNVHHAATNVVGRDGDIDLMPLWATVAGDLKVHAFIDLGHILQLADASWLTSVLPYQHIYWTFALPLLRLSWLIQSIQFVSTMHVHYFEIYRKRALIEQLTLFGHWVLVLFQLYLLPSMQLRILYFLISQLFSGFLTAHVVTYNHYSTEKFANESDILDNYPCLQVYTTRNMRPSIFIDWLWGGLNYQIEHHLFPTMPRHNLHRVMPMVKAFCAKHNMPYMVDDYWTGWQLGIQQFANVAKLAGRLGRKVMLE